MLTRIPHDTPLTLTRDGDKFLVNVAVNNIPYEAYNGRSRYAAVAVVRNIRAGVFHLDTSYIQPPRDVADKILYFLRQQSDMEFRIGEITNALGPDIEGNDCAAPMLRLIKAGRIQRRATGTYRGYKYTAGNWYKQIAYFNHAFIYHLKQFGSANRWQVYERMGCAIPENACKIVDGMLQRGTLINIGNDILQHHDNKTDSNAKSRSHLPVSHATDD